MERTQRCPWCGKQAHCFGMDAGGPWVAAEAGGGCPPASWLLVTVCCVPMQDFLYSIGSYAQKCGVFGQICPTGHPIIPPKYTLAEVGYLCLHLQDTLQNKEGFCLQNLPPRLSWGWKWKSHNCGIRGCLCHHFDFNYILCSYVLSMCFMLYRSWIVCTVCNAVPTLFFRLGKFWGEFLHSPCAPGTYAAVLWSLRILLNSTDSKQLVCCQMLRSLK